ncbi:MAG TPA: sigma-54 dependent transcriptional regulator [Candidatus Acidoferrales bacterium]|nr:sigma-54 dependent transcriptional regulator [Candidatus Acidoferrales bacterium]
MAEDDSAGSASGRPAVLVVDDEPDSVSVLRITLHTEHKVYTATDGATALRLLDEHPDIAVAIIDQRMPGMSGTELIQRTIDTHPHLVRIILTGYTDIESLIEAINAGRVYRYLTKPWKSDELRATVRQGLEVHHLAMDNLRLQAELQAANARLRLENTMLRGEVKGQYRFEEIVGVSPARERMLQMVERAVPTDLTVLIQGETGTGKELVARAIHYNGPRADKPFVTENCGALAPELLTSELFGHRRGAFTGAAEDRVGLFEFADGGTLFLDEIGDCPMDLQVRLLRVLDQREIRRVGDNQPIKVDVRVIAATHQDLRKSVEAGLFRKDLYYRLAGFVVSVPPLRDRRDDIGLLAQHFLDRQNAATRKVVPEFTAESLRRLAGHDFPGNIRELENEVRRAHAMARENESITPDLLSENFSVAVGDEVNDNSLRTAVERFEAQIIREALTRNNSNQTRTAEDLGIGRRTLLDKMHRYGLGRASEGGDADPAERSDQVRD